MKVRIELELESWMAEEVLRFAEKLEKNWQDYKKRKEQKKVEEKEKEKEEEKERNEQKSKQGQKRYTEKQIRYFLLKKAWAACSEIAKVRGTTKEQIWDEMKRAYGIESTKGMSNDELERFVDFVKEKKDEEEVNMLYEV